MDLAEAVNEVTVALSPLPADYYIEADEKHCCVLVCCKNPPPEGLGFAVTAQTIQDGRHVDVALEMFPSLVTAVEQAQNDAVPTGGVSAGVAPK